MITNHLVPKAREKTAAKNRRSRKIQLIKTKTGPNENRREEIREAEERQRLIQQQQKKLHTLKTNVYNKFVKIYHYYYCPLNTVRERKIVN
jgi:hypothetical protein